MSRTVAAWVVLALLWAPSLQGQDTLPRVTVQGEPAVLNEGTVAWIRLRPSGGAVVAGGMAAGEPVHFEPTADGAFRALVGIPIAIGDSLPLSLILQRGDHIDTVLTSIRVQRSKYPHELLAVPPAFVKPDSATAVRIEQEIARSREVSHKSQERPRLWRGPFRLPRASRITSGFGTARVYNGHVQSRHLGTDFAGAVGAPVRAAGRGVVALVANFYLAGRAIYIDHGAGVVTAYFHLSRAYVAEGDTVRVGQRIGAVGHTGRVTGPHLHWVARYGVISVDPMSLLELEKPVPEASSSDKSQRSGGQ